jgi:hypothetical protein
MITTTTDPKKEIKSSPKVTFYKNNLNKVAWHGFILSLSFSSIENIARVRFPEIDQGSATQGGPLEDRQELNNSRSAALTLSQLECP